MRWHWFARACLTGIILAYCPASSGQQLRTGPLHDSGQSITAAYEGWFRNSDGSFSLLFGYFNRNLKQQLDIPIGPNNRVDPGGPDRGQPSHFLPRRQWGVFTVTVPKDFGSNQLTWTLNVNGETSAIPASLNPLWELSPMRDVNGNAPPSIGFSASGPFVLGPRGQSETLTTTLPNPITLALWVADDASLIPGAARPKTPAITIKWSKYRGPGSVTFSKREAGSGDRRFLPRLREPSSSERQSPPRHLANRENMCCMRWRTIGRAKAVDFNAAGRTRR